MDRLIRIDQSKTVLIRVEPGQKYCNGKITLHNMMHTMPVAFKLQPLIKSLYTVKPQSGIISPLATLTIDITYHLNSSSSSTTTTLLPHSNDSFLLHSVLVPGAAIKEPSSMFDAVPSEWFKKKQVFIDSSIKVMFVGSHILVKLLAHAAMHNKSKEPNVMEEIRLVLEKSDPSWRLVNSTDSQGETLLHMAISQGRPDLVQLLLEFEPDIEIPNRSGYSALETASACNEALIVELLLAHKANTERSESAMYGSIHHATRGGHVEVLRLLLLKGANVDSLTKDGNTALHIGVEEHRRDCVRLLLANGARTDAKNQIEGDTPLHVASAIGDENMVKLLLQNGAGATKYVLNGQGKTAYNVAVENGHGRLYDALCLGDKLCMAARKGEARGIEKVLESGAGINGRDQNGWTALHRASLKGRMEGVKILVEKGMDVDAKDEEGYTALHCAVESGHADVTEFLVKKGADVEARTDKGVSALQIAESLHYVGITRVLLNGGASRDNKIINNDSNSFVSRQVVEAGLMLKKKKKNMRRGGRSRVLNGARFERSMALSVL